MDKSLPLDDSSDSEVDIKINEDYAGNYEKWRHKEELQKLKDKYGDSTDTSSSSESEDGNEPIIERDFLKTLSLLKSKDPKIYNDKVSFFTAEEKEENTPKEKKTKPLLWKDYERQVLLREHGESRDEKESLPDKGPTYDEEQQQIKQSFVNAFECSDEDDDNLLKPREKTKSELEKEDKEYILWMKSKPEENSNDEENEDLKCLRDLWNDPKLDGDERFLRDYILNEKYKEKKSKELPTYEEITEDIGTLSDDEKILKEQELFEHKFNFRFEEPDFEFVKRYPRTVKDSLRRDDGKRKMKREDYKERKLREKEQKKEEILRLKALKRKEIKDKLDKLKEITGNEKLAFEADDINGDFDPHEHDRKMNELFGNQYYDVEEEKRPSFPEDEEFDYENWDNWTGNEGYADADYHDSPHCEDPSFNMDADYDPKVAFQREMIDSSQQKKKKKRGSKFASAISRKKPVFDPTAKTFEDYFDEYYKLDYEDIIGDLPVRFKYRKVTPNDFGLSVDEILSADDKELNRWCSLKKACQYRSEQEELYDVQAFQKKANNENAKKKIFFSLYENNDSKNTEKEAPCPDNQSKKRKRKKKNMSNDEATLSISRPSKECVSNANEGVEQEDFEGSNPLISQSYSNDNTPSPKRKKGIQSNVSCNLEESNDSKIPTNASSNSVEQPKKSKRKKKKKKNVSNGVTMLSTNTEECANTENRIKQENFEDSVSSVSHTHGNNAMIAQVSNKVPTQNRKKKAWVSTSSFRNNAVSNADNFPKATFKSKQKPFKSEETADKRLSLSDDRLRAYGINPKKFKNSIKYFQKRKSNSNAG